MTIYFFISDTSGKKKCIKKQFGVIIKNKKDIGDNFFGSNFTK